MKRSLGLPVTIVDYVCEDKGVAKCRRGDGAPVARATISLKGAGLRGAKLSALSKDAAAKTEQLKRAEQVCAMITSGLECLSAYIGKLPGGLIEDAKSKLVKLKEQREKQNEKNTELEKEFERLKKKKGRNSEDNRKLGKLIKQLAEEKAKLKEMEEEIEQLEKEVSEEEEKKERSKKISDLDGSWRGNDFEWSSVTIDDGEGTSSFGNFKVEKKKLVVYYDFKPEFSRSMYKGDRRYHHEYEFSGAWQTSSGDWSGKIGLHLYSDRVIHVIYETYPGDNWTSDNFLREDPAP